jgi:hypothetical protein
LLGPDGGLPQGSKGVVLAERGRELTVQFDAGWGTVTANVPRTACQLIRRRGGVDTFRSRTRFLTLVRLGLGLALALPVLVFAAEYIWQNGSTSGLAGNLALGALDSTGDLLVAALHQPVQTAIYCAALALASRLAFRRR